MFDEYKKELELLKEKMIKAEEFSKKIPLFSKKIIEDKLTGEEDWIKFGNYYKSIHCAWGINRGIYTKDSRREVTNYSCKKHYSQYLFNIYINTLCIYDSHKKYGLFDIKDKVDLFYFDDLNRTFYVAEDNIEPLLDALSEWKEQAVLQADNDGKQGKIDKLQLEIDKLNDSCVTA